MKIYFPKMISFFAISTMLMLSACGGSSDKDDPEPEPTEDTTNPVIATPTAPTSAGYGLGGEFVYTGDFTDDTELKQVVFSLSDNKTPGSASLKTATGVDDEPWAPEDVSVTISGTSATVNESVFGTIPSTDIWTGIYTLTVTCTDAADNSATKTIDVNIGL